jgi:LmbE family N-acetylglucosaminyl deacetylase
MVLIVDDAHQGTPAAAWASSPAIASLAPLEFTRPRRVVVVSPHPDDEVLGAGGLLQTLLADQIPLHVVAVTDGEASHPRSTVAKDMDLPSVRSTECREALRRLGWSAPLITRLGLPDGEVAAHGDRLRQLLAEVLRPGDMCLAPWPFDGHPDHDASGDAVADVGDGLDILTLSYLVWTWHWADPNGSDIPWASARRLDLGSRRRARKRWATGAFRSQVRPLGPGPENMAILPDPVLRRSWQPYEIFVDQRAEPS